VEVAKFEHGRPFVASATALFYAATSVATAAPDHCIVGESVFGCRSEAEVAQITSYDGDVEALHERIADGVSSGDCQMFQPGEPVYQTRVANGAERAAVRRPADTESYWMPASWSRPASECSAFTTSRTLREKLGLAATTQASAPDPDPAEALSGQRPTSPRTVAGGCSIKPVMTDAEIALCRNLNR
jgi:hypothetical protein